MRTIFLEDVEKGEVKEREFEKWAVTQKLWNRNVAYLHKKFDFYVWFPSYLTKVDVKTLTYEDSVCIEDWQDIENKRGWYYTTTAEWIVWIGHGQVIWLKLSPEFRAWWEIHKTDKQIKWRKNRVTMGKYGPFQSSYYNCPIDCLGEFIHVWKK